PESEPPSASPETDGLEQTPKDLSLQDIATDEIESTESEELSETGAVGETGEDPDMITDEKIAAIMSEMSLDDKICQMFIITPEALTGTDCATRAGEATKAALTQYPVGGLIYFAKNLESQSQTKEMLENTSEYAKEINGLPLFLCVDEEGGRVARCAEKIGMPKLDNMFTYKDQGSQKAVENARMIADYLKDLGFNLDFAPVADTWSNSENTVIGERAYSDDFAQTAELVSAAVSGFKDEGVLCCIKHFPGHGDTQADSHTAAAVTAKTPEQLADQEYLAFKSGIEAGADMVMAGHITVSAVTDEPASVSEEMISGQLRGKLGYSGVVITDALNMKAVSDRYPGSEIGAECINAGVDILLMPSDFKAALAGVKEAVESGKISEDRIDESVKRILKLKLESESKDFDDGISE
ncbi:MAG: glycoside hydrolase family 3, partial [Lachnospiraceae bacterium]|nr:glycoside hydrolase family 3 [Lachnospiraceae bacterium]